MENSKNKKSWIHTPLDFIEKSGNKLPDPLIIFISLAVIILFVSFFASKFGLQATNPASGETVEVVNLLSKNGLTMVLTEAVNNFATFPPLGLVLAVMIGVGLAEKSGYFDTLMKYTIDKSPAIIIIPVIIFVAILGNAAGDAAPIILPPIAAMVFIRLGYHPIAGLVMAYAASLGGFSANIMIGMTDVLVLGFTEPAAAIIDESVSLNAAMNYYFLAVSTVALVLVAWFVTNKITIPRFGEYTLQTNEDKKDVTSKEAQSMWMANISIIILLIIIALLAFPENAFLRNTETGSLINDSPLMDGIVPIVTLLFFMPGFIYGLSTGTINSTKRFAEMLTESMSSMGGFIVIVFFAAQMIAYFEWSKLGEIIAIKGAEILENQHGIVLILGILILSALVNMILGSASAKWAILAPVLVPMMMLLGYHPAFTQVIYRVGDSITNPITPMLAFLPLILSLAKRYDKDVGIGTILAALMPYSVGFFIFWTILLIVWYLFDIPVGIGGPIKL